MGMGLGQICSTSKSQKKGLLRQIVSGSCLLIQAERVLKFADTGECLNCGNVAAEMILITTMQTASLILHGGVCPLTMLSSIVKTTKSCLRLQLGCLSISTLNLKL